MEQRLDDEAEPVIAEGEALVLEQPGVAALDRPAALAKARSTWLATLVDVGFSIELAAESPIGLGVIAFVGEDGANAGRDREGGQEQPFEDEGVADVGGGGKTSDRDAGPVDRDSTPPCRSTVQPNVI